MTGRTHEEETVSTVARKEDLAEENEKLRKQVADLEACLASATEHVGSDSLAALAAGISHRFNNILFAINGNVELIKMRSTDGKLLNKYLERISAAVGTMASLNNRLLAYSGSGLERPRMLDLGKSVKNALEQIRAGLPEKIKLNAKIERGCETIKINESQLRLLVEALVENAVESITGSGEIRVETGKVWLRGDRSRDGIRAEPGFYMFLRVSDTGVGMDDLVKERIFEPFFTTKFQGRGLGMSAVYGILKKNGCRIDVESEIGKGSCVTTYFPAEGAEECSVA